MRKGGLENMSLTKYFEGKKGNRKKGLIHLLRLCKRMAVCGLGEIKQKNYFKIYKGEEIVECQYRPRSEGSWNIQKGES